MKMRKKTKASDLSFLSPCRSLFWLHCLRANYVAGILKRSIVQNPEILERQNYGWNPEGRIHWLKQIYPGNDKEILVSCEYDEYNIRW